MKRILSKGFVGKLLIALMIVTSKASLAVDTKLILTGSSTVAPLAAEIAKRFEKLNPGVQVDVQSGGSSRGINDVRQGLAHIGLVSRALNPAEQDLMSHTIALDGIGIIVHRSNPLQALTDAQIIDIYTGKIRNWKELGGREQPITVINKAEGRSTLELFLHYFQLKNKQIRASVVIGDNAQGIKTLIGNPGAIAYVSIGAAEYESGRGVPIKLLPVSGVEASTSHLRSGNFPLMRPLNLVTKTEPSDLIQRFVDFARSDAVQDIVINQYFVSPDVR